MKKGSEKENKIVFRRIGNKDDICVERVSDASYNQEGHSMAGELILLGNKYTNCATPIYWKSRVIRKIYTSPKAAETRAVMKIVDDSTNIAKQMEILMKVKIPLRIFTD